MALSLMLIPLADDTCMDLAELLQHSRSKELLRFVAWFCQKEAAANGHTGNGGDGSGGRVELLSGASQEIAEVEAILRAVRDKRGPLRAAGYNMLIAGEHEITGTVCKIAEVLKENP